ncbi:hypothetical protein ACIF6L_38500 [Kitasatospora sp. NPDC086009]|uniref:hypothetical protein n=1 Tax=unclassified Kitasatospora TaxID=2633591 RepID=UPI0037CB51DD
MTALHALAEFGSTGAIGSLCCGARLNDIAVLLGEPHTIGRVSKRSRWPHLFSFGDVELCVCRCRRVTSMCLQTWRDTIDVPAPGSAIPASHPGRITIAQVSSALAAINCALEPVIKQPPGQMALQALSAGVTFTFTNSSGTEALLKAASVWTSSHECVAPANDAPDDGFGA